MNENLTRIIGIELLCAVQGVDFRAPLSTSERLARVVARVRAEIAGLDEDRILAPDIERAAEMVGKGHVTATVGAEILPQL
jgi:histidine ammonia-lyase